VGVVVADQEVQHGVVEKLDHLPGRHGGGAPDQCEAVGQRRPALGLVLARSRDAEGPAEVFLVKTHDPVIGFAPVVALDQQLTIALQMIDAVDIQLVPFDSALRGSARKQAGCRALMTQIYGVGELTAVTILAELGDPRRF